MGHPREVRGTQSFVHTLSSCWRRPSLTALEVAWRWVYGVPALALLLTQVRKVLLGVTDGTLDPARLGLDKTLLNDPVGALSADPLGAAAKFEHAIGLVLPSLLHVAAWLAPTLLAGWVVASSLGRTLVLRRADSTLRARPLTLIGLQAIRLAVLLLVLWLWFSGVQASARIAITGPIAANTDPNLILYCAMVIVLTLSMFTAYALGSWIFQVAPLVAMVRDLGVFASLRAATKLGPLRGKLMEVNLVLGVVKIALLVLAMTFSATPLPFQDVATAEFLAWWWAGVILFYLLWSDFFHVARLVGYLNLWRTFQGGENNTEILAMPE